MHEHHSRAAAASRRSKASRFTCNLTSGIAFLVAQGKVIIIGAGPAGLAAASSLKRAGVEIVVLEARDRIGGRVHSYKGDFGAPVDLGASLITGGYHGCS